MNKPEYMKNISLSYPQIEESMDFEELITHKFAIAVAENFDDAVHGKIIDIAKEEGFNSLLLLNKKDIAKALEKQIPKKPTPHIVEPVESPIKIGNMNWGRGTTIYYCPNCKDFISRTYTYCHKCGQALDWSDTE